MTASEIEVIENQAALVECDARFMAAYGGRGSGKTFGAQLKMWGRLRNYPRAGHYVCGADFEQLRGGYFLDFRILLEEVFHWKEGRDFKYRDLPRPTIILLDTGARIRALSSEVAERIRSTQIQSLHAEEPQTWHNGEQVWRTLVGSFRHTVRSSREHPDMAMQAWMTFNPIGAPIGSWLHTLVTEQWVKAGYPSWRFDLHDNYLLHEQAQYIEDMQNNLPPSLWPVEIEGFFPTSGGGVYRNFNYDVHAGQPPQGLPGTALMPAELLWAFDFNVGYQCSTIAQAHVQQPIADYMDGILRPERLPIPGWQRRVFAFLDEIAIPDAGTENVIDEFLSRYEEHARQWGVVIYGDPSGGARSQLMSSNSSIRSHWDMIKNRLEERNIRVKFRVQMAAPAVYDRVTAMNAQFQTGKGYGLLVDPLKCPVLIKDWVSVKFKPGTNDIEKKNKPEDAARLTHMSDAAGYMIYVERKIEAEGTKSINWTMVR